MVNQVAAADAVHPLAQASIELPKPKQPIVPDPEGIEGVDSAQQPHAFLRLLARSQRLLDVVFSRGFWVSHHPDVNTRSRPPMSPSFKVIPPSQCCRVSATD